MCNHAIKIATSSRSLVTCKLARTKYALETHLQSTQPPSKLLPPKPPKKQLLLRKHCCQKASNRMMIAWSKAVSRAFNAASATRAKLCSRPSAAMLPVCRAGRLGLRKHSSVRLAAKERGKIKSSQSRMLLKSQSRMKVLKSLSRI